MILLAELNIALDAYTTPIVEAPKVPTYINAAAVPPLSAHLF